MPLNVTTDIHVCFEEIRVKFQRLLNTKQEEMDAIIKDAVDNFDFQNTLHQHVQNKIHESLEKVFEEIDLSESLKLKVWAEIEKQIGITK